MAARTFSELFEPARVLVRFDHVASIIINADHGTVLRGYDIYAEKEPA